MAGYAACAGKHQLEIIHDFFQNPVEFGVDIDSVPSGTTLIVILAESLSSALVDERVHGVPGLTPNIADFSSHAFTFRNLYSSDFPTIKGQLATLASFAFDHRGLSTTANAGNPMASNYMFLSDVLKLRSGYTTLHMQSDFASFSSAPM
jgi:phosphoglycerol transferase MdoB-like AlkP superfamily enzyme